MPIEKLDSLLEKVRNNTVNKIEEYDIDDDEAQQLAKALTNNRSVRTLWLRESENLTQIGWEALLSVLPTTNVQSLDLSDSAGSNESIYALAAVIANTRLNSLNVSGVVESDDAFIVLCQAIQACGRQWESIDIQLFSDIDEGGVHALCELLRNAQIKELLVGNLQVPEDFIPLVINAVINNRTLHEFDMFDSALTAEEELQIENQLMRNKELSICETAERIAQRQVRALDLGMPIYLLYREGGYSLSNDAEELVGGRMQLINRKNRAEKPPFLRLLIPQDALLANQLIDKYLYLIGHREQLRRDLGLSDRAMIALHFAQFEHQIRNAFVIRESINVLLPEMRNYNDAQLKIYLEEQMQNARDYFGDELSDDSDDEDQAHFFRAENNPRHEELERIRQAQVVAPHTLPGDRQFWRKIRRETPKSAGLADKLPELVQKIQRGEIQNVSRMAAEVKTIGKSILSAALPSIAKLDIPETEDFRRVRDFLAQHPNATTDDLHAFLRRERINVPFYVAQYRGINYMVDRWNADSRRYHRKMDEVGKPLYSESLLRTLPFSFYSELSADTDFTMKEDYQERLVTQGLAQRDFLQDLKKTPPCIGTAGGPQNQGGERYLFNTISDRFQQSFSNGIDNHLAYIAHLRKSGWNLWRQRLPNAFNYAVASGDRPFHALKYAYGLKDYYRHPMYPRYKGDGRLEYPHVGKIYASLHPLDELLSDRYTNHVSHLNREGRIQLGERITPEKETAFLGYLEEDRIFYQMAAKFPSFVGEWQPIDEIKYGLNQPLYEAFKYLIRNSLPQLYENPTGRGEAGGRDNDLRWQVIRLLGLWLCLYEEALLVNLAQEEARKREGMLVYINQNRSLSLMPDKGQALPPGDMNIPLRNSIHIRRSLRRYFAQIAENLDDTMYDGPQVLLQADVIIPRMIERLQRLTLRERVRVVEQQKEIDCTRAENAAVINGYRHREAIVDEKVQQELAQIRMNNYAAFFKGGVQHVRENPPIVFQPLPLAFPIPNPTLFPPVAPLGQLPEVPHNLENAEREGNRLLEEGDRYMQNNEYQEALVYYRQAGEVITVFQGHPELTPTMIELASVLLQRIYGVEDIIQRQAGRVTLHQ